MEMSSLCMKHPVRKKMDIERLLHWAYQNQAVDRVLANESAQAKPSSVRSSSAIVERYGLLGTSIDCAGSSAYASNHLHPDAERIHETIMTLPARDRDLIIAHAKSGLRPDPMLDAIPRPVMVTRGNRKKPMMIYYDQEWRRPAYCLLRYTPDPDQIIMARKNFLCWWDLLDNLSKALWMRGLVEYIALAPAFHREPWKKSH